MIIETRDRRWHQFLVIARERFEEVIAESVSDCRLLLEGAGSEPQRVATAWTAMRLRAQGLRAKVEEVWESQVREQYHALGAYEHADAAEARGQALRDWMEIELARAETSLFADLARLLLDELAREQAKLRCQVCDAPLGLGLSLHPREHECRGCGASQVIDPGPRASVALEHAPNLWRDACWEAWVAKRQAELLVRRARELTLAQLKAWEQAEIDYLCAWLRERAKLLPEGGLGETAELRRRLERFYASLEREAVWIEAGRPRALP